MAENDPFDILNNISEYVTLVQLMDSLGNFNHAISIVGYWIFESKHNDLLYFDSNIQYPTILIA